MRDSEFMRGVIAWMIVFVVDVSELGPLFALAIISSSTNPKGRHVNLRISENIFVNICNLVPDLLIYFFPVCSEIENKFNACTTHLARQFPKKSSNFSHILLRKTVERQGANCSHR